MLSFFRGVFGPGRPTLVNFSRKSILLGLDGESSVSSSQNVCPLALVLYIGGRNDDNDHNDEGRSETTSQKPRV